jgi:integrase
MSDHNVLVRHIKPVAKKLGLSLVNWQVMRRSAPSWQLADGADIKSVQAQMRHSTSKATLDIYAQLVSEGQRRVADNLMDDLNRLRNQPVTAKSVPIAPQLERFGT